MFGNVPAKAAMPAVPATNTPSLDTSVIKAVASEESENIRPHTPSNIRNKTGISRLTTPKGEAWSSLPMNVAAEVTKLSFKPQLESDAEIRGRVRSTGYGKDTITYTAKKPADRDALVIEELGERAFTPDMKQTDKQRASTTSSGYGKASVAVRKEDNQPKHSFSPDTSVTAKKRNKVASSGYGKMAVSKKKVDMAKHTPTFKPDMDVSQKGSKMRKQTQARHTESPRPKTPGTKEKPKVRALPRYTLAADRDAAAAKELRDAFSGGFVLDGNALAAQIKGKVSPVPLLESVKQKSLNKKLTKGATSTLYGSAWEPPVGAKVEHTSEPVMMLAGKSTYIDRPEAIPSPPKMSNKLKEKVAGHYNAEAYEPRRAESPAVTKTAQSPPKYYTSNYAGSFPPLESIEPVKPKTRKNIASTGYGVIAVDNKPATPAPAAEATPATTTATATATPAADAAESLAAEIEETAQQLEDATVDDDNVQTAWA